MDLKRWTIVASLLVAFLVATQGTMAQTSYTLTVSTNVTSYVNGQAINITGKVSPPPGPSTGVALKVVNPSGDPVAVGEASVGASTGLYNYTLVAGGTSSWVTGVYTVDATWGAYPPQIYSNVTFSYSPSSTTTTTSTVPSSSTTSTSSTSSPTTSIISIISSTTSSSSSSTSSVSSTSSSSSTSKASGIPEFPFQAALTGLFALVILSAYLVVRRFSARPLRATSG